MPRLRRLSGADLVRIFEGFGFSVAAQEGSHIKLRRETPQGRQTLIVPQHRAIKLGTCRGIYREAAQYIPEAELRPHFYSD